MTGLRQPIRNECKVRARSILAEHREQAVKLIDRLYEHGEVIVELPELLARKD